MPVRVQETSETCTVTVGSVSFVGRIWTVQPHLPTPADATSQATTYRAANTNKSRDVEVYSGIRYAQAPVGDLRFKAPVAYTYPNGSHDVSDFHPPPHQRFSEERGTNGRPNPYGDILAGALNWPRLGTRKTEDCLRLSIFRPRGLTNRPAIYHVHGGGWGTYHAMTPQHFGAYLAAHMGVVVVVVGYRLSTFGHFPLPGLSTPGEPSVAYLDQRMGLQWVNTNGAAFGCDVSKIMVTGSSAGGASTMLFLEDDDAQSLFSSAWPDSGGGSGNYAGEGFYLARVARFANAVRAGAAFLACEHPDYITVKDAFDDGRDDVWVWQHALRVEDVEAMADPGPTVTYASVKAAIAGTGPLVASTRESPENVYPFLRGGYANAVEAAKAGKFRKPTVISYAEHEASVIAGSTYESIKSYFNALPTSTLNGWAARLGFADFASYAADWVARLTPFGYNALGEVPGAIFNPLTDPTVALVEEKRTLYGHAVYGWPAWRIARAMKETDSAPVWLVVNNFSANATWAGHSGLTSFQNGNTDWPVGIDGDYPAATPPGVYTNMRMDAIYFTEMMCKAYARMAATGDPNGAYDYEGFDLFTGNPPADGGDISQTWPQYDLAQAGHHIVLGKYIGPLQNLNGGNPTLDSQRDAKLTFAGHMGDPYLDYLELLEPAA